MSLCAYFSQACQAPAVCLSKDPAMSLRLFLLCLWQPQILTVGLMSIHKLHLMSAAQGSTNALKVTSFPCNGLEKFMLCLKVHTGEPAQRTVQKKMPRIMNHVVHFWYNVYIWKSFPKSSVKIIEHLQLCSCTTAHMRCKNNVNQGRQQEVHIVCIVSLCNNIPHK